LNSGDDLVTVTKVDLGHSQLLAAEICLDRLDIGEAVQCYILHHAHGLRLELEEQLILARASYCTHTFVQIWASNAHGAQ
jgi:hypothetical protein